MAKIARFAWALLAYDIAVIAWGAFVRASGSGAGCGRHWPMCNGEIVPRAPRIETLIELSHRGSSGVAAVLTLVLLVWVMITYPPRHRVRRGVVASMAFMAGEVIIGRALVLFELVARDASMKRALSMSLHLGNSFLLLAATALTAWWASGGASIKLRGQRAVVVTVALPLAAMLLVGASGAVAALGDTLFPAHSLATGFAQDFAPGAHIFVRLRAIHPVMAVLTAAAVVVTTGIVRALRPTRAVRLLSRATGILAVTQVGAGLLDVVTRAPVALQLAHLVLADLVWIALVLTSAAALVEDAATATATPT